MKFLVNYPEIAMWIIGLLLTTISTLIGFVLWYVLQLIKEAKGLNGKISKNNANIIDLKQKVTSVLSSLYTSEKNIWDELIKLRRSVVSGTMVLRRRKEEVNKILEDSRRVKSTLDKHSKILDQSIKVLRRNRSELDLLRTKTVGLSEQLIMIKDDKESSDK
jgi:hypothetical protein